MTGSPVLLDMRSVSVCYRRGRASLVALDRVSFDVRHGETVGLVGESGSGKTTAGRAVLGLAHVDSGTIAFNGLDITHMSFKQRRPIYRDLQIVFQDPYSSLNPARTIGSTLAEPLEAFGVTDRRSVQARVRQMLERVHLPVDTAERYPRQFSGGQRQRIAIARALMLSPKLVIFDEPTSALDLSVQAQILNLLQELQTELGLSFLFISHDLEVVRHLCDRVVVLYQGRVMETGPTERLATDPAHPYTQALNDAVPLPDPLRQRARRVAVKKTADEDLLTKSSQRCYFAPRCLHAEEICRTEEPALRPSDDGLVACHRFPQWRAERGAESNGGATSSATVRLRP